MGENKVKCMACDKIVSRLNLPNHRATHISERKYRCELCYGKFKTNSDKKVHMRNVHKSEEERVFLEGNKDLMQFNFKCRVCDLTFLTEKLQSSHEKTHEIKIEKIKSKSTPNLTKNSNRCKLCYKKFLNLVDHQRKVHTSEEEKRFKMWKNT